MGAILKQFYYGGQAVIEGVMMRGRNSLAIAVRKADGNIVMKEERLAPPAARFPMLRWPLVRGVVALVEAMVIGIRALNFSASQFAEGEEEELGAGALSLSMVIAFALTIGLFVVLPALIIRFLQPVVHSNVLLNLIEGGIKIGFFLGYIAAISFMPDIRRVFQYHGAEHKAINCLEAGMPLTVENVQAQTKIHKRCGTSFILFVLLISVFVFSFFGRPPFLQRILLHLALLPVVSGLAYEVIRQAGKDKALFIFDLISRPGMWTQLLTTREPDAAQVEVAIRSLEAVLAADQIPAVAQSASSKAPATASGV